MPVASEVTTARKPATSYFSRDGAEAAMSLRAFASAGRCPSSKHQRRLIGGASVSALSKQRSACYGATRASFEGSACLAHAGPAVAFGQALRRSLSAACSMPISCEEAGGCNEGREEPMRRRAKKMIYVAAQR